MNILHHHREPASIDEQPVIRQNRDTLYTFAVVDISQERPSRSPTPETATSR